MERLFQSVVDSPDPKPAVVSGQFPSWLRGRLFRLGPAKWDLGEDFTLNHWFDGCALVYRFTIQDGKVDVMSRFLNTEAYQKMTTINRPVFTEFGTKSYPDPCKNVFSRFFTKLVPLDMTDNDLGNIYPLGDELYCTSETCFIWKIDKDSLKTMDRVDMNKVVSVNMASSHPHRCVDGTVYNLAASFMTGLKYHIVKMGPSSAQDKVKEGARAFQNVSLLCTISSNWTTCFSYYHSFGLSEHYLLFLEQSLLINTLKMAASGMKGHSLKECFEWSPKEKTRFHLIDRMSGQQLKIRYQTEAMFVFHHINTYEEDGHIVADVMAFDSPEVLDKFYLKKLRMGLFDTTCQPQMRRYVIPLKTDGQKGENLVTLKNARATAVKQDNGVIFLHPQKIGDPGFELPTINYEMFNTKKYKYVYGSGVFETGKYKNSIVKLDVTTERVHMWRGEETMFPSEVTFVPRPGTTEEDDGILLSVVLDAEPGTPDFLLVLDAKNLQEVARADVPANVRLPPTIHGCFLNK